MNKLEKSLGYKFNNKKYLQQALTHSSATSDIHENYERLEFLGDRILGLTIADILYTTFPDEPEGSLAQRFVVLVCKETVAEVVRTLDIKGYIQAINTNVNDKDSVLCDVGEALIAAIYKDSGSLDVTQDFIKRCWQPHIDKKSHPKKDYKTLLQEQAAVLKYPAPVYKVISKTGPEHAPMFVMEVSLNNDLKALGKGSSKKQAEQAAAALMLNTLGVKDA